MFISINLVILLLDQSNPISNCVFQVFSTTSDQFNLHCYSGLGIILGQFMLPVTYLISWLFNFYLQPCGCYFTNLESENEKLLFSLRCCFLVNGVFEYTVHYISSSKLYVWLVYNISSFFSAFQLSIKLV